MGRIPLDSSPDDNDTLKGGHSIIDTGAYKRVDNGRQAGVRRSALQGADTIEEGPYLIEARKDEVNMRIMELAKTPPEGYKTIEKPLAFEVREAREEDIELIQRLYKPLLFPREWFECLAQRNSTEEMKRIMENLSGGGELAPIPAADWKRRIQEERVLLIGAKEDAGASDSKIIAVHSYIVPDNETNSKKIVNRLRKINELQEAGRTWLEETLADNGRHVLMTEDIFIDQGIRHKGLHKGIYLATLQYELSLPQEKRVFYDHQLEKSSIYYWVNFFLNAWMENSNTRPSNFTHPPFNTAMVIATLKAGGKMLGYTHRPDSIEEWIELSSENDPDVPHRSTNPPHEKVRLVRSYFEVQIPMTNFVTPKTSEQGAGMDENTQSMPI